MKNEVREKLTEMENRFVTGENLTTAVDKLGEEIAFDINSLETSFKEMQQIF